MGPAEHLILGYDPQRHFHAEAVAWLKRIGLFHKGEDERMFLQQATLDDLAMHTDEMQG